MGSFVSGVGDLLNPNNAKAGLDAFSGVSGAKAAEKGANLQAKAAADAIAFQRESRDLFRSDLAPFSSFATGDINSLFADRPAEKTFDNFDWRAYLSQNPDVAARLGGNANANRAWNDYQKSGRAFTPINATKSPLVARGSAMGQYLDLLNPQKQADYLTNNPMFQAAINQFGDRAKNTLGFGGLKGDLANSIAQNYLATGQNYIDKQRNALLNPIQIGQASAAGQAAGSLSSGNSISDLITGAGNARAAGGIGAANAYGQGAQNVAGLAGAIIGAFSDRRLKTDIEKIGEDEFGGIYKFRYKHDNQKYIGRMADEIQKTRPDAVININGYLAVSPEFSPRAA